jgi:DNA polymerase elongation subunit (family B)
VVDYDTASLAARTAEAGRTVLTRVIALLQDSGNDGTFSSLLSIIGGDTDALLVRINDATITNADQAEALLRTRVLPFINTSLGEPIEFSLQWIACSLYMHSMKQYAYLDARTRTITCKGLEEVRGSTPRALQQALQHATEAILHSDDNASAAKTLATYVCNTRETLTLQEDPAQAFIMIPRHARTTAHREPYTLADSYDANRPQEVYVRDLLSPAQAPRSINIDYCIKTHFLRPIERRITVLTNNTSNSGDNGGDDEDNAQAGDDDDDDDEQDSSDDRRVVVAAAAAAAAAAAVSNVEDEMKE